MGCAQPYHAMNSVAVSVRSLWLESALRYHIWDGYTNCIPLQQKGVSNMETYVSTPSIAGTLLANGAGVMLNKKKFGKTLANGAGVLVLSNIDAINKASHELRTIELLQQLRNR